MSRHDFTGKVLNGFLFQSVLGKGCYGEVWKAKRIDGKEVAVKVVETQAREIEKIIFITKNGRFFSPFLVKYYDCFEKTGLLFLVMELCTQGTLDNVIESLNPSKSVLLPIPRLVKYMIQLILAVYDLHLNKVVHRDIKGLNVFMDFADNVKLGDFGCGHILNLTLEKIQSIGGTVLYMAPELGTDKPYDSKADMWSLGVLFYYLCACALPFTGNAISAPIKICKGDYPPIPAEYKVPPEVCAIVVSLLTVDPEKRPSARELLMNPYIQNMADRLDLKKYFPSKRKTFIWRDTNLTKPENSHSWEELQETFEGQLAMFGTDNDEAAFKIIDAIETKGTIFVASNRRDNGLEFLTACRARGVPNKMVIYCQNIDGWVHQDWVDVRTSFDTLVRYVESALAVSL